MSKSRWVCNQCGHETVRQPFGKCAKCGAFQDFSEVAVLDEKKDTARSGLKSSGAAAPSKAATTIKQLSKTPINRTPTGIGEFDRVLGGGIVDAEVIVLGAPPGAGKSSLCLEIANRYALMGKTVLYSSGEESEAQIGMRAERFGVDSDNIKITHETNLETLLGHIEQEKPDLVIVDSLQTIASSEINGTIGSIGQSLEAAHSLTRVAKTQGIAMILINQVVKS